MYPKARFLISISMDRNNTSHLQAFANLFVSPPAWSRTWAWFGRTFGSRDSAWYHTTQSIRGAEGGSEARSRLPTCLQ
jgi:hypothetical protein